MARLYRRPLAIALAALTISPVVSAADIALEEVIVTATKRETTLLETPASISAFDQSSREQLGIFSRFDLEQRTPSLKITSNKVVIRGVGRPNNALGSDPGVGIYWDGVYQTENGIFSRNDYLDIERIEILRGPQGTLYGRNSIGGAVNFISTRPSEVLTGKIIAQAGNYDATTMQGLLSGPVTDKLSVLGALSQKDFGGTQKNTYNGRHYGKVDQFYGSLALEHRSTDRWTNSLKYFSANRDNRPHMGNFEEPFNREYIDQIVDQDTGALANFPGMFPGQNFANMRQGLAIENPSLRDVDRVAVDFDPTTKNEVSGVTFISEIEFDSYSLKYTGGASGYDYDHATEADHSVASDSGLDWSKLYLAGTPVADFTGYTLTPADMIYTVDQKVDFQSHELQFSSAWNGSVQLIAGLYYYTSDEDQLVTYQERNNDLMAVYAFFGGLINKPVSDDNFLYRGHAELDTISTAIYGQMDWDWTEHTKITVGLRYSEDEKEGGDNTFVQFVGDPENPTVYRDVKDDWSETTWRVGFDHIFNDGHFLYGFIATGYRSGGFNLQKPTSDPGVDIVDPETLLSYELGYKGALLDNRVNVGVSAYFYDYSDLQVLKSDVVNGIGLNTFENADDAEAYGIELDGTALLSEALLLSGTYSYNKTEYKNFESIDANACALGPEAQGHSLDPLCTTALDLGGNQFPLTPEHKLSLNVTYSWAGLGLSWSATGSYLYTGDMQMSQFNNSQYDAVDDWDTWNARLNIGSPNGSWLATLWVNNLTDSRDVYGVGRPSTVTQNAISNVTGPRLYGVRLQYGF